MKTPRKRRESILRFEGYAAEIGGKLTFVGVLQSQLEEISKKWANKRKTDSKDCMRI